MTLRLFARPIPLRAADAGAAARALGGGRLRFERLEAILADLDEAEPRRAAAVIDAGALPGFAAAHGLDPTAADTLLARLSAPRPRVAGLSLDRPRVMGVVNVTPDSFSDGGRHADAASAVAQGLALVAAGADLLDIGGESTRPGAADVPEAEERARVAPVIEGLIAAGCAAPISIDTRKPAVARAAFAAGARLWNDVSALGYDPASPHVAAELLAAHPEAGLVLMHARGAPATMQRDPRYRDVTLEVAAFLEARLAVATAAGCDPARILLDPGVGFGKTMAHNLRLLSELALLHGLGHPLLLGVSRKRFIGALARPSDPARERADARASGSVAAALAGAALGVQLLRVHDMRETAQALAVWTAARDGEAEDEA